MKFILSGFILLFLFLNAKSQSVSPLVTDPICPVVNTTLTFTITSGSPNDYTIQNDASLSGCTIVQNISGSGNTGSAIVQFSDKTEAHKFNVYYSGTRTTKLFTFTKIETLQGTKPTYTSNPNVHPTGVYDDKMTVAPCNGTAFTYAAPQLKYKDAGGTEYGNPMNSYGWLVPKGWKVGSALSNGTNYILALQSATITPDLTTGGEVKIIAYNAACGSQDAPSDPYRLLIDRAELQLLCNGLNTYTVSCGEDIDRVFTIANISQYSCVTASYKWDLHSTGNGWNYTGSAAPATITTTSPTLTLRNAGELTQPNGVNVILTLTNGTTITLDADNRFAKCDASAFSIDPASFPITCGNASSFNVNVNHKNIAHITGYVWDFHTTASGWKVGGSTAPQTITTTVPSLYITSDGGLIAPGPITITPQINNQPYTSSYTPPIPFQRCCSTAPTNLSTTPTGSNGRVQLNWDPVNGVTQYNIEYQAIDGSNHTIITSATNTATYYGPSTMNGQFRVSAKCSNGITSDYSPWYTFSVTQPAACNLATPSNLLAYGQCGAPGVYCGYVHYQWSAVPGAYAYDMEAVVYNPSTGQSFPTTTGYTGNTYLDLQSYTGTLSGSGWVVHFRVRTRCTSTTWTNFGPWSANFSL